MLPDEIFLVFPQESENSPSRTTLSFTDSPTVQLGFVANRYTRYLSKVYLQHFGIGVMDWRMLVMLAREPGSNVSHASRTIGIDKAAVSRCLKRLEDRGLAKVSFIGNDERRKDWNLTSRGGKLHDCILKVSLSKQKQLLNGFSEREVRALNQFLSRMLENLVDMQAENSAQG